MLSQILVQSLVLACALALPHEDVQKRQDNTLPNTYTVTVYKPSDPKLNGLKVEGDFSVGYNSTASYCPTGISCPNGTELAFHGTFGPDSIVPGGQDSYVQNDGLLEITVQHSHFIPPDAYAYGIGWSWHALPADQPAPCECPTSDSIYNCTAPSGYFTFQAPNATVGGVRLCNNPYDATIQTVWAVTPNFNGTNCTDIDGLATHEYTGEPVWAYY